MIRKFFWIIRIISNNFPTEEDQSKIFLSKESFYPKGSHFIRNQYLCCRICNFRKDLQELEQSTPKFQEFNGVLLVEGGGEGVGRVEVGR